MFFFSWKTSRFISMSNLYLYSSHKWQTKIGVKWRNAYETWIWLLLLTNGLSLRYISFASWYRECSTFSGTNSFFVGSFVVSQSVWNAIANFLVTTAALWVLSTANQKVCFCLLYSTFFQKLFKYILIERKWNPSAQLYLKKLKTARDVCINRRDMQGTCFSVQAPWYSIQLIT